MNATRPSTGPALSLCGAAARLAMLVLAATLACAASATQAEREPPSDIDVTNAVSDRLLLDHGVDAHAIGLSGAVGSAAEHWRARVDAMVAGVEDVAADDLDVEFWARNDDLREKKFARKSDEAVRSAIESALALDPRVTSDDVSMTVDDGVATLTGSVDTWTERQAATENALEGGAIRVINELSVSYGS